MTRPLVGAFELAAVINRMRRRCQIPQAHELLIALAQDLSRSWSDEDKKEFMGRVTRKLD